jgi:hypothetical protein
MLPLGSAGRDQSSTQQVLSACVAAMQHVREHSHKWLALTQAPQHLLGLCGMACWKHCSAAADTDQVAGGVAFTGWQNRQRACPFSDVQGVSAAMMCSSCAQMRSRGCTVHSGC